MNIKTIEKIRKENIKATFDEHSVNSDPLTQFALWFEDVIRVE